jgi:hypothetical protein
MLSEYRQRFGDFHTEFHREDYLYRSGRKRNRETAHVRGEYSDLFSSSAIAGLRAAHKEIPEQRETERASLDRLIAFAVEGALLARAREISAEIGEYESRARIDWGEGKLPFLESAASLANEIDPERRRDLFARRADVIKGAQDLRAERLDKLREGALAFGYENRLVMRRELRGVDCEKLAEKAGRILSKTEGGYVTALSGLLAREIGVSIGAATAADLGFLRRSARRDDFFPPERMPGVYRELFAALGFSVDKQSNVVIDSEARLGKQPDAFCAPIRVPEEIMVAVNFTGGQANYREFLRETGKAQSYAWTSRNIYPEFRIGADRALVEAWGLLLENLTFNERWLMATFGFAESAEFRHALAVFRLMTLRRLAALARYETEVYSGSPSSGAGARYAELMTDAIRVRVDDTDRLRSLDGAFHAADFLRAAAFEAQLHEYFKTRFGECWWDSRKAGETLIDIWNTGQRYTVERLASMIGLGEPDFDWLASESMNWIAGQTR